MANLSSLLLANSTGAVPQASSIVRLRRGFFAYFVQTSDNKIYSWGWNNSTIGQLGQGTVNALELSTEIQFPSYLSAYSIVDFTVICATAYVLWSNGDLYGWGDNASGQLGIGNTTNQNAPTLVAGPSLLSGLTSPIAQMYYCPNGYDNENNGSANTFTPFMFIKTTSGVVYGAGYGAQGCLANGGTSNVTTWTATTIPTGATSIANIWVSSYVYANVFCQTNDGKLWGAGQNNTGALGIGNTTQQNSWANISFFGTSTVFADIQSTGALWDGTTSTSYNSTTFLTNTGLLYTVGADNYGQLGNGGTTQLTTPVQITIGGKTFAKIIKSNTMVWALMTDGTYARWGLGTNGSMGNGTTTTINSTPIISTSGDPGGMYATNIWATTQTGRYANVLGVYIQKASGLYYCGFNDPYGNSGIPTATLGSSIVNQTLVPINNAANILDIKTSGYYNSNGPTNVIVYNNSNDVYGVGDNLSTSSYSLNSPLSQGCYAFRNLKVIRTGMSNSGNTLQQITTNGATTSNALTITNAATSGSSTTGALIVTGGIGISGNSNFGGTVSGLTAAQFDNTTKFATTGFVKTVGEAFGGINAISAVTTLTAASAGQLITLSGTTYTITLPAASTMVAGSTFSFVSTASGAITITRAGSDTISVNNAFTALTSLILNSGDSLVLVSNGSNGWVATAGSVQSQYAAAQFTYQLQPITATVASNALTVGLNPTNLTFRNTTVGGASTTINIPTALSLVVPTGATLGTTSATAARLVVLALNNAGTVSLGIINWSAFVLDEAGLITSTAISSSATSSTTLYSSSALTNVAYRVVGYIDITEATAGTWATAPTNITSIGGCNTNTAFPNVKSVNGYQKLPGGLIIQWGITGSIAALGTAAVTFPIAFPNAMFTGYVNSVSNLTYQATGYNFSNTGMTIYNAATGNATTVAWLAIGY